MQDKDAVPKGDLSKFYEEGVLFVTYSLLVSGKSTGPAKSQSTSKRGNKARGGSDIESSMVGEQSFRTGGDGAGCVLHAMCFML